VIRRRRQQQRCTGGEQNPEQSPADAIVGRGRFDHRLRRGGIRRPPYDEGDAGEDHGKQRQADSERRCLLAERQPRLEQPGIRQQGEQRTDVRDGEQTIRLRHRRIGGLHGCVGGARVPRLKERACRRQCHERQPDQRRQHP
jgi:hypothetical protein